MQWSASVRCADRCRSPWTKRWSSAHTFDVNVRGKLPFLEQALALGTIPSVHQSIDGTKCSTRLCVEVMLSNQHTCTESQLGTVTYQRESGTLANLYQTA